MYADLDPLVVQNLARSHDVVGRLLASVNGSPFTYPVNLVNGSVSVSGNSGIRRKLSATIEAFIDDAECDVFRTEIRAEYGIRLLNGDLLYTPVGTFVLTDAQEQSRGQIAIQGEDRWRRIVNARFLLPVTTSGLHTNAIKTLVEGADGRIVFQNDLVSTATHTQAIWERDRDKAIMELAKSIGAVVYFDAVGKAHLAKIKSLGDNPDWTLSGGDGGVISSTARTRSQGNTYNAMVVEGENSSGTVSVSAAAVISDPQSPLLYGGPFARRPRYYRSPLISTQSQADATALALLSKVSGQARTVTIDSLPHPGLDAGDIIRVEVTPQSWETHIVDSFDLPLGPGKFTVNTRTNVDDDTEMELQ
jgi:hypothetical protein